MHSYPAHHQVVFGDPAVRGELLQHGHHELQTAIPVAQQEHHTDQVYYTHHCTRKVIGHMEDLGETQGELSGH